MEKVAETFNVILKKERTNDLIPFLRSLDKDQKKFLAAKLKPVVKEFLEFREVRSMGSVSYKQKATAGQVRILEASAFVCLNRKDYERLDRFNHLFSSTLLEEILPWYCPDWFSDMINGLTKRDWMPLEFTYLRAMSLVDKGYLQPTDALIARLMPQAMFLRDKDHTFRFDPGSLTRYDVTLREHIWLIFQFETSIHNSDRYLRFNNAEPGQLWMQTLKHLAAESRVDRKRVLSECLLTSCRNFNKNLTGWFIDLFAFFEPSEKELMSLQSELLSATGSPHSKAVNKALECFKKIVQVPDFNHPFFFEQVPVLLSAETRSVVTSTLLLLEKLASMHPSLKEDICVLACTAFIHNDESIQKKVVMLINRYGGNSVILADEINKYRDSLLSSTRNAFKGFQIEPAPSPESGLPAVPEGDVADEPVLLDTITTLDELIFLSSQALENHDPLHFDLLPAAFVNLQREISEDNVAKFAPALQRAYALLTSEWSSRMGYIDHLLGTFFIHAMRLFIERFPTQGASLDAIEKNFLRKEKEKMAQSSWYRPQILNLASWSVESRDNTYIIHKAIMLTAYEKLKNSDVTPMLSTPTYVCGYVDPAALVHRLRQYKEKELKPENLDFQLAISRIGPFNHRQALQTAREVLDGEELRILEFLLQEDAGPVPPYTTQSLWFVAGITKSPRNKIPAFQELFYASLPPAIFTGEVPWKSGAEHYIATRYNVQKRKQEQVSRVQHVMRLMLPETSTLWQEQKKEDDGLLSKLGNLFRQSAKSRKETYLLYEFLSLRAQWLSVESNDIQRILYLFPSNPDPVLALVASRALVYSTFPSETDKRIVANSLDALTTLQPKASPMTSLFIGTCMLTSDKTVRSYAAELWTRAVNRGDQASFGIGKVIGAHLSGDYAPLKRLTDLISENMMKISALHSVALETMLSTIIVHGPDKPPTGTKRLIELYSETLSVNQSRVSSLDVKSKLTLWAASSTLAKVIRAIPGVVIV